MIKPPNLSADIYCDHAGKRWTARIYRHPSSGGPGIPIWDRGGMRTRHNAETAMEAAWQHLNSQEAQDDG